MKKLPIIKSDKSLRGMSEGDHLLVKAESGGYTQRAFCRFITIEKGFVVAEVLEHFVPRGHTPIEGMTKGSIVKKRAKSFFLWFQGENDGWPRCHWFTSLDEPAS